MRAISASCCSLRGRRADDACSFPNASVVMNTLSGISGVRWALIAFIAVGTSVSLLAILMLAVAVSRLPDDSVYSPSGVVHAVVSAGSGVEDWVYQETVPGGGREAILVERIYLVSAMLAAIAASLLGFSLLIWFMRPTRAGGADSV